MRHTMNPMTNWTTTSTLLKISRDKLKKKEDTSRIDLYMLFFMIEGNCQGKSN